MTNYFIMQKKEKYSLIEIDSRTKIILMILGNIAIVLAQGFKVEIILMSSYLCFGFLCGAYKVPIKIMISYFMLILLQHMSIKYLNGTLNLMIITFAKFIIMILPCALLGSIVISTTKVNEFMAGLNKMKVSKKAIIPLTVMFRYFSVIVQQLRNIKDAMKMRDITPSFLGFIKNPGRTIECVYVPMLIGASKAADELSAAAITRGIENPNPRTYMIKMKMKILDYFLIALIGLVIILEILI